MPFLLNVFAVIVMFCNTINPLQTQVIKPERQAPIFENQTVETVGVETITNSKAFYGQGHNLPVRDLHKPILIEKTNDNQWMLWFLVAGFLSLSFSWFNYRVKFRKNLKAVIGMRFFLQINKDGGFFRETYNYLLYLNFLLVLSLLIYQSFNHTGMPDLLRSLHQEYVYSAIFLFLLSFYVLKFLLVKLLAWVFNTQKASIMYLENIFLFNQFAGVTLLPLVFHNAFNPTLGMLYFMWFFLIGVNLFKITRGSFMAHNESGFSLYYLFLYLCGVELTPLLIVYKVVTSYIIIG